VRSFPLQENDLGGRGACFQKFILVDFYLL
jgi:hypothetical protein